MNSRNFATKTISILAFLVMAAGVRAQQIPLYSQFYFNKFLYNPALTGMSGNLEGYMFGRRQYVNIDGYQTAGMTVSGATNDGKMGLGLYYINDRNSLLNTNSLYGNYAYNLTFNENTKLSFGFALGMINNQFDFSRIITTDPDDPILRLLDKPSGAALDASIGANFLINGFNLGLSIPQMLNNSQKFTDNYNSTLKYNLQNHLIIMASYDLMINNDLKLQPLLLFKNTANSPSQVDVNITADWLNKGWLGFGIRDGYGVTFMGGIKIAETVRFGYSYDAATGQNKTALGGTHEFLLGLVLGKKEKEVDKKAEQELELARLSAEKKRKEQDAKIKELEQQMLDLKSRPVTKDTVYIANAGKTPEPRETERTKTKIETKNEKVEDKTAGEFLVIAGSFSEEKNATLYFNQLVNKGLSPYMYFDKSTKVYYVHMGKFYFKEEARDYLKNNSNGSLKLWVKTIK